MFISRIKMKHSSVCFNFIRSRSSRQNFFEVKKIGRKNPESKKNSLSISCHISAMINEVQPQLNKTKLSFSSSSNFSSKFTSKRKRKWAQHCQSTVHSRTLATLPNFDSLIDAAGNDEGMRPMEVYRGAKMRVSVETFAATSVRNVPDPHRFVITCRKQKSSTRMPSQASYPIVVAKESEEALAGTDVPYFDGLIARSGSKERSYNSCLASRVIVAAARFSRLRRCSFLDGRKSRFRCPSDALHNVVVFSQLGFALFGVDGPHAHGLIVWTRRKERSVDR